MIYHRYGDQRRRREQENARERGDKARPGQGRAEERWDPQQHQGKSASSVRFSGAVVAIGLIIIMVALVLGSISPFLDLFKPH